MADATLRIVVDTSGAIVPTQRVARELDALGVAGTKVESKLRHVSQNVAFGLSSMAASGARDITSILRSFSGLGFAFGAGVGVITLAVSSIADAWSESKRKAKDEQEKMLADMASFTSRFTAEALKVKIAALEMRRSQLEAVGAQPTTMTGTSFWKDLRKIPRLVFESTGQAAPTTAKEIQLINDQIHALRRLQVEVAATAAAKHKTLNTQELINEAVQRWLKELDRADDLTQALKKSTRDVLDAWTSTEAKTAADAQQMAMDQLIYSLNQSLDLIGKKLDAERRHTEELKRQREVRNSMLIGMGVGAAAGALAATGPAGGVIGSAVGAAVGATAGGPWAMAAAGTLALVGGLFGLSKAARAARDAVLQAAEALAPTLTSMWAAVRGMGDDFLRMIAIQREARQTIEALNQQWKAGLLTQKELNFWIGIVVQWERQQKDALRELAAEQQHFAELELDIRAQRALGNDEYAEAMARQLEKERELAQARQDGATETDLARLAEIQRAEDLTTAMNKIKANIESLTGTITGLQDFRNQLLLSDDAGLSSTAKLEEARRQYAVILRQARNVTIPGVDGVPDVELFTVAQQQEAAGRLPGAAQTLLNLSRQVNASGTGFQSDLAMILADNQAVINKFQDLRTIEEEMLEQLRRIRDNTDVMSGAFEEEFTFTPITVAVDNTRLELSGQLSAMRLAVEENTSTTVASQQGGFQELSAKLDALTARVDETTAATTRIVGDLAAVLQ